MFQEAVYPVHPEGFNPDDHNKQMRFNPGRQKPTGILFLSSTLVEIGDGIKEVTCLIINLFETDSLPHLRIYSKEDRTEALEKGAIPQ